MGGNIVNITLAVALAVFACRKGGLPAESRMVQTSAIFTVLFAILPFVLIYDGVLGRLDGLILILFFVLYVFWLFAKKERFSKIYQEEENKNADKIGNYLIKTKILLKDVGIVFLGLIGLILSSKFLVSSTQEISLSLNIGLPLLGILIVGLGDTLPEIYFGIVSARKNQNWMILGDILGAIIFPATLILGIIAMLHPIVIADFSPFLIARVFLVISALYFLFAIKTGQKITKKEGVVLLLIYILFLIVEIFWYRA
jgi:cation:H+ antiporter